MKVYTLMYVNATGHHSLGTYTSDEEAWNDITSHDVSGCNVDRHTCYVRVDTLYGETPDNKPKGLSSLDEPRLVYIEDVARVHIETFNVPNDHIDMFIDQCNLFTKGVEEYASMSHDDFMTHLQRLSFEKVTGIIFITI